MLPDREPATAEAWCHRQPILRKDPPRSILRREVAKLVGGPVAGAERSLCAPSCAPQWGISKLPRAAKLT